MHTILDDDNPNALKPVYILIANFIDAQCKLNDETHDRQEDRHSFAEGSANIDTLVTHHPRSRLVLKAARMKGALNVEGDLLETGATVIMESTGRPAGLQTAQKDAASVSSS